MNVNLDRLSAVLSAILSDRYGIRVEVAAMRKITIDEWKHIPAGETVENGFAVNGLCTAPAEPGFYTLYELVSSSNTHLGWEWEKE